MNCPKCNQLVEKLSTEYGIVAMCQTCFGHFLHEKSILKFITYNKWNSALNYSKNQPEENRIVCPSCKSQMDIHSLPEEYNSIQINRCSRCKVIWFDKDKIEELNLHKTKANQPDLNNKDLNSLAQGLLLDAKLTSKKKELERGVTSRNNSDDSDFGLIDILDIGFDLLDD